MLANKATNRYDKYKDSGIEWIGEIPDSWDIKKIKYCSNVFTGNSISDDEKDSYTNEENAIPYVSTKDIDADTNVINYDNGLYIPIENDNFKVAPQNSSLLCVEGGSAGRKIGYTNKDVCFVNKLCCFSSNESSNSKFLYYTVQSDMFLTDFNLKKTGLIGGVSQSAIKNIAVASPNFKEQQRIADYLDKKCSEIDTIVEKQKSIIEKLKEYKQSIITQAVTKGLDKSAPMKDSSIEWIGQIPKHWEVCKLLKLFKDRKCPNKGNVENNVLSLSYGNIKRRNIETNMGLLPESFESYNIIEPNNIVLRLTDLQNDHKSLRCALVKERGIITSAYLTLELKNTCQCADYFYRLLHTFDIEKGFYGMGAGVRQSLKYDGELCNLYIIKPPVTEQEQISEFLDKKCSEIDKTIESKEKLIEKLVEYKKSLIYECVTGKRKVLA